MGRFVLLAMILTAVATHAQEVDFNRDVRPILSDNCFACHGPDAEHREADLRLDQRESALADLGGYQAVAPGNPDESELIARIVSEDDDTRMPPTDSGKTLTAAEKKQLARWIEQGANWSPPWSTIPPRRHDVPSLPQSEWPLNWIDLFILKRLQAEDLAPAASADPVTLVRRLSFDLVGLPPTPSQVDQFVTNCSPDAYENLVDTLLASPHFGERMTMYWLDLVRFADTVGYHGDQTHNIWPYRDYVIHAFNTNKPFDEFTHEQLAGDLLPEAQEHQLVASGYNRLLQTSHEGGVQLKEYRSIYMADRVRNVSQVWLGATLGCAQCHDHKFDPLTTREFYELGAFFADIDDEEHIVKLSTGNLNGLPTSRQPEIEVLSCLQRDRIHQLQKAIESLNPQHNSEKIGELQKEVQSIQQAKARTMISRACAPRIVRVLPRGNWLDETGPEVQPGVPECFGHIDADQSRASRLDLARWLTADDGGGGLTARVMVNRFWYLLFGQGIAGVLDDFGGQGEPPVHPELLDNLAVEFVESGWDVQRMMKLLVMSRAYRQSSQATPALRERDPHNRLIARQSSFRLPAEMVRDAGLAISRLLVEEIGGPSVKPYQPPGIYRHLNFPVRSYQQDNDRRQWRRGLYVHWQRQFLHPQLKAFDATSREECTAARPRSNTPLAALTLLNDPTFVEAARVFAESILSQPQMDTDACIEAMFRRAVSRSSDAHETDLLRRLLFSRLEHFQAFPDEALKLLDIGLSPRNERLPPEQLAAWTFVARAILNLNETIQRN